MRIYNPNVYIEKVKLEITTEDLSLYKIKEWIEFVGLNIKN